MFIRAYLRASTQDQDANRAKDQLLAFTKGRGQHIASFYVENESGTKLQRPELMKLLEEAGDGDVLLVEQVDRLSRLTNTDWEKLKGLIQAKGVKVVALDLPTSHMFLTPASALDFTGLVLKAINGMMLDMLAAIARKDYEDRRRRQEQGIQKAKQEGKFRGRQPDDAKRQRIRQLLEEGKSRREVEMLTGLSHGLVQKVASLIQEKNDSN
jgi:DNA invertase Pin-like site-specific DNA recombinase